MIDNKCIKSCSVLLAQCNNKKITTVEGIGKDDNLPLDSFIDSGFYTSENNLASNLLNEIRKSKLNLAIVGERSSASGIVTLEDILEEVIGEIEDEHD